ncbi:hypothetical protein FisN_7Lh216 [Fistulifera solaris]|uniref:Uncharacterized protein n=1 Tax=Fistulifera solaris TaxID=1519565 RepID=A0A1Z5JR37_FISSO|nr:hypothetical protein FisN_7Lh216 [Fistulifera solaris]|eukprot:GAX16500.1 hypothetical protein FisN_7Lh216 [Fistulifera solaris]
MMKSRRLAIARLILLECLLHPVTSITVHEYAARPIVQKALASPQRPESVLSFFFAGVDYNDAAQVDDILRNGACLQIMQPLWWTGDPEYDALCRGFSETVRQVGKTGSFGSSKDDSGVLSQIDKTMSELILCDQLSRNCSRGEAEAFAYEPIAIQAARSIAEEALGSLKVGCITDKGEIYPPYLSFCATAMMHSESLADHDLAVKVIELGKAFSPSQVKRFFELQMGMELAHMDVIKRFGRFPHRNDALGRQNTSEEALWLSDYDNLPAWAKSQMKSSGKKL